MTPTPPINHTRVASSPNANNRRLVTYNAKKEVEANPGFFNGHALMAGKVLLDLQKNPGQFVISPNEGGSTYSIQFVRERRLTSLEFTAGESIEYEGQRFRTLEAFLKTFQFKTTDALPLSPAAKAPSQHLEDRALRK